MTTCQLLQGWFSYFVQGALAALSFSILIFKYCREKRLAREALSVTWNSWNSYPNSLRSQISTHRHARDLRTFCLDLSKQAIGAGWVHVMSLAIAVLFRNAFPEGNECEWYWVNIMVDTTIGVGTEFVILWTISGLFEQCQASRIERNLYMHDLVNGVYVTDDSFDIKKYLLAVLLWLGIVTVMKVINTAIMLGASSWMVVVAQFVLEKVTRHPQLELVVVMLITPTIMNMFQFWVTDNFIRFDPERWMETPPASTSFRGCLSWDCLVQCAKPMLLGLIFNVCFVLVPMGCGDGFGNAEKINFGILKIMLVFFLTVCAIPYYLVICCSVCPTKFTSQLAVVVWFVTTVVVVCCLYNLPQKTTLVVYSTSAFAGPAIWLLYGLGFSYRCPGEEDSGRSSSAIELRRQAVTHPLMMTLEDTASQSLLRSPLKQWFLLGLVLTFEIGMTLTLFHWLAHVRKHCYANDIVNPYLIFGTIVITCKTWKVLLKCVGFTCDCGISSNSFSSFFVAFLIGTFSYNFVYRAVYLFAPRWETFLALHAVHLAGTWGEFVLPASGWFYDKIIRKKYPDWIEKILKQTLYAKQDMVTHEDFSRSLARAMSLNFYCVIFTIVVFAASCTALYFGPNKSLVKWSRVEGATFPILMLKLGLQLVTEIVNASLIELWYRKRVGSCIGYLPGFMESWRCHIGMIGACWATCIWPIVFPENKWCD